MTKKQKVYGYAELAESLIEWGEITTSEEKAQRSLLDSTTGIDVAGAALLAIIKKLREVGEILRPENTENKEEPRPANAKAFPDKKVGDSVWFYEMEGGLTRMLVVAVREDGYIMVCNCDGTHYYERWNSAGWAWDEQYATPEEAMHARAIEDLEYHLPKVQWLQKLLEALKNNADLSEFENGFEEEE